MKGMLVARTLGLLFVLAHFFFANAFIACRYGYGTIIRPRVLCSSIPRFGSCINFFGDPGPDEGGDRVQ